MIPRNEQGTIALFAKLADELGYTFKEIGTKCPDAILIKNGQDVRVEFELESINFKHHKHNPNDVDLIICWSDNWENCPVPVLDLETYVTLTRPEPEQPKWKQVIAAIVYARIWLSEKMLEIKKAVTMNKRSKMCALCGTVMSVQCYYNDLIKTEDYWYSRDGYAEWKCQGCGYIDGKDLYHKY